MDNIMGNNGKDVFDPWNNPLDHFQYPFKRDPDSWTDHPRSNTKWGLERWPWCGDGDDDSGDDDYDMVIWLEYIFSWLL